MSNNLSYLRQSKMPHIWCPGCGNGIVMSNVIRAIDATGIDRDKTETIEYSLKLDSNPEFTACVLVACARAVDRMAGRGCTGGLTVFDIAPADLSPLSAEELRRSLL